MPLFPASSLAKACCAAPLVCLVMSSGSWVIAQQDEGGRELRLTFGQTLAWSDNPELEPGSNSGFYSRTSLALSFRNISRRDRFEVEIQTAPRKSDGAQRIAEPTVRLRYARDAANSRLNSFLFFRRRDLNDRTTTILDDADGDGLGDTLSPITLSRGSLDLYRYGFNYDTGLQSPVGLSLFANRSERRYSDVDDPGPFNDPDLFDRQETVVGVTASFQIDPRITLRANARQTSYEAEDVEQTERETTRLTFGGRFLVSQSTVVDLDIGSERTVTEDANGRDEQDGLALDLGVIRELRNGTIGASALSGVDQNGRFDSIRFTRALTLRSGAELSFAGGVGRAGGQSAVEPLYGFSYEQDFRTYRITANLIQQIRGNDESSLIDTRLQASYQRDLNQTTDMVVQFNLSDYNTLVGEPNDRRRLNLGIGLNRQINSVSNLGARFDYVATDLDEGAGTLQEEQYGFGLTYQRLLTRDVSLLASYNYVFRNEFDAPDTDSNTVSLTIQKDFSLRP